MQIAHCTVKHAAKHYHAVRRINVSVPEILLLQAIHGEDAVREVAYAGESDRDTVEEMEHLHKMYGGKEEIKLLIEKLFPGARPVLPSKLSDIGFDVGPVEAAPVVKDPEVEGELIKPPKRETLKPKQAGVLG